MKLKIIDFLQNEMGATNIRFPETSGIGVKPVSKEGTERLVRVQFSMQSIITVKLLRLFTKVIL